MKRTLTIQLDGLQEDAVDDEIIVEKVLELISQGYVCGYEPFWEIKEVETSLDLQ